MGCLHNKEVQFFILSTADSHTNPSSYFLQCTDINLYFLKLSQNCTGTQVPYPSVTNGIINMPSQKSANDFSSICASYEECFLLQIRKAKKIVKQRRCQVIYYFQNGMKNCDFELKRLIFQCRKNFKNYRKLQSILFCSRCVTC